MKAILIRNEKKDCTMGVFVLIDNDKVIFTSNSLELNWRNNEFQISCIPKGTYIVVPRTSKKYGKHFHLKDVKDRSLILIHVGNFISDTKGCILVGDKAEDNTIKDSRNTLGTLLELAPLGFELTII